MQSDVVVVKAVPEPVRVDIWREVLKQSPTLGVLLVIVLPMSLQAVEGYGTFVSSLKANHIKLEQIIIKLDEQSHADQAINSRVDVCQKDIATLRTDLMQVQIEAKYNKILLDKGEPGR